VREKGNLWRIVSLLKTGNLEVGQFVTGIKIMRALKINVADDHFQWCTLVEVLVVPNFLILIRECDDNYSVHFNSINLNSIILYSQAGLTAQFHLYNQREYTNVRILHN
jgi:hypothetical protein